MIGFRLDANEQIAMGHMMRCIAIAKQCQLLGEDCIFLLAEEKNTEFLEKNQLMYYVLNADWKDWDSSIPKVIDAIDKFQIRCLVVDSYQVTHKFFNELYTKTKLFYVDDICGEKFPVHMTLHYSQWGEERTIEDLYSNSATITYSGLQYVPIRKEFLLKEKRSHKKQILVTTGGTDPLQLTLKLCRQILKETELEQYDVCAILGKMNRDKEALDILAKGDKRLRVYQNIRNMGDMMRESTISVSAGGTTVYELFSCGVPVVCLGFADNQIDTGERMENAGMVIWAGDARINEAQVIKRCIEGLKHYASCDIDELSHKLMGIVDGKGCERIAKILRESTI